MSHVLSKTVGTAITVTMSDHRPTRWASRSKVGKVFYFLLLWNSSEFEYHFKVYHSSYLHFYRLLEMIELFL